MKQLLINQARWSKWRRHTWLLAAVLAAIPAAPAQAPRFSVTSEQVVTAMRGHAWPIEGVRVTLPAALTAAVADPKLGIETASMLTSHEARLRIVCRVPAACLPFFANAVWPENEDIASRQPSIQAAAAPGESSTGRLRAGASVTLLLEGQRVHIRMQAVCLQGGATGDKIRVATRDRKQMYVAEIVTPTLLRGSLPE